GAYIKLGILNSDLSAFQGDNRLPSQDTTPRYYGPKCSSSTIAAASMFAHAARVFGGIASMNAYAQTLENAAVASWNHVLPQLNSGALDLACDDGTIKAGDADWTVDLQMENALSAAIYLYALTGNAMYQTYIAAHINDAEQMSTGFWGPYKVPVGDALLTYASLPAADAIIATNIQTSFSTDASNNYNGYYGFNTGDLYRAYMPGWSYHWGSNNPKASYGNLNLQLNHFGLNTVNANDYENKAEEQLHYFHGVNPLGMVHLSNMYGKGAENCVNEIYHTWFNDGTAWDNALTSTYGPAPGFLTGGTNPSFSVTSLTPPFNQPNQKAYLDFNDGWPNNSWEITEPAIYYQAAYLRLLAGFVDVTVSTPLPVELLNFSAKELDGNVTLSWESISEINSSHFVVERSRDGSQFTTIATQEALGVNQSGHQYKMEDRPLIGGRLYYRLKMVDLDGRFSYSSLEQVNVQIERLHIFPNPFAEQLTVQIPNGSNLQDERWFVRIYDQLGRQILFEESPKLNNGQLELDLSAWEDGIYFLNIALPAQGFAETQTLMKN
ncbi:MAG: glycoside hydrolase family 9 protein, partial [Bacteroidota bacterium]